VFWSDIYDEEEYGRSEFPDFDAVIDTLPASSSFWRTAVGLAISGVGFPTTQARRPARSSRSTETTRRAHRSAGSGAAAPDFG